MDKMTKERTTSYVFTIDPQSTTDWEKLNAVKAAVRSINNQVKLTYKYAVARAWNFGDPLPKAPTLKRVRLMGRGPRRINSLNDSNGRFRFSYDSYLPMRHATRFDVYIADKS